MKVVALIVSFALFLGGLFLMYLAPTVPGADDGLGAITFVGGIIAVALSFGLPIHWLGKFD